VSFLLQRPSVGTLVEDVQAKLPQAWVTAPFSCRKTKFHAVLPPKFLIDESQDDGDTCTRHDTRGKYRDAHNYSYTIA